MPRSAETLPRLLNRVEDAQAQLGGIGKTKMYELIATGQLQTVKIGRRTFIAQSALDDYVVRLAELPRSSNSSGEPPGGVKLSASGGIPSPGNIRRNTTAESVAQSAALPLSVTG